jgi:anaerobic ribonucleoside-triphosphate reductase
MHSSEYDGFFLMITIRIEYCRDCGCVVQMSKHTKERCDRARVIMEGFMPILERTAVPKAFYDAFSEEAPREQ